MSQLNLEILKTMLFGLFPLFRCVYRVWAQSASIPGKFPAVSNVKCFGMELNVLYGILTAYVFLYNNLYNNVMF